MMFKTNSLLCILSLLLLGGCSTKEQPLPIRELVLVNGGTYRVGSPSKEKERRIKGEENIREVVLDSFLIENLVVTQDKYSRVMSEPITGEPNYPKTFVSWYDAIQYCNTRSIQEGFDPVYTVHDDGTVYWDKTKNGYRLPTSDEWEVACRAGTDTPYYTGQRVSLKDANFRRKSKDRKKNELDNTICIVGTYKPNPLGLYDMMGNVYEWCWDAFYDTKYVRGGYYNSHYSNLRSAAMTFEFASTRVDFIGFRVVRNAQK